MKERKKQEEEWGLRKKNCEAEEEEKWSCLESTMRTAV